MYQVVSREMVEQPTLTMMGKVPVAEIPAFLGKAYSAVSQHVTRSGLAFAGAPFARYRPLDDAFAEFEIEAGFPVLSGAEGSREVAESTLPGGVAAVVTHVGPYDQMKPAYEAIEAWIIEHDGQPDGPAWEVYYSDPSVQPNPATWRTEIIQPYKVFSS